MQGSVALSIDAISGRGCAWDNGLSERCCTAKAKPPPGLKRPFVNNARDLVRVAHARARASANANGSAPRVQEVMGSFRWYLQLSLAFLVAADEHATASSWLSAHGVRNARDTLVSMLEQGLALSAIDDSAAHARVQEVMDALTGGALELVMGRWTAELMRPAFAVYRDKGLGGPHGLLPQGDVQRRVVIVVRGTMSVVDILTDLLAAPARLDVADDWAQPLVPPGAAPNASAAVNASASTHSASGGATPPAYGHGGMVYAARDILREIAARHGELLADPAHTEVVLAGHSLGAGVSSIAAALLRRAGFRHVRAFVTGTPPVLDLATAESVQGDAPATSSSTGAGVFSLVYRYDIVSRLQAMAMVRALEGVATMGARLAGHAKLHTGSGAERMRTHIEALHRVLGPANVTNAFALVWRLFAGEPLMYGDLPVLRSAFAFALQHGFDSIAALVASGALPGSTLLDPTLRMYLGGEVVHLFPETDEGEGRAGVSGPFVKDRLAADLQRIQMRRSLRTDHDPLGVCTELRNACARLGCPVLPGLTLC